MKFGSFLIVLLVICGPQGASAKLFSNVGKCSDLKYSIPASSELEECRSCDINDKGTLTCSCPSESQLPIYSCRKYYAYPLCAGPLRVVNGKLTCKAISHESTYLDEGCFSCLVEDSVLKCECVKEGRLHVPSDLDLRTCTEPISNCRGTLTCGACKGVYEPNWIWLKAAAFGVGAVASCVILVKLVLCKKSN